MSDYEPSTLRSVAQRAAASPNGIFPGIGLAAFSGALQAALRWTERGQSYLFVAHEIGVSEEDARAILDEVAAARLARGLPVADDDTFRAARSRLYRSLGWPA